MRTLAAIVITLLAAALPGQAVNLIVQASTQSAGTICGPWNCTATPLAAPAGSTLNLRMGARPGTSMFLLVAPATTQCTTIPGLGGSLIATGPAVALLMTPTSWVNTYINGPQPTPCATRAGIGTLALPANLPIGSQLVLQTLAVDSPTSATLWTFSNAIRVTIQ